MIGTLFIGLAVALLILGPLIILHEFGHYFAARLTGVKPLEYGFGFPPRITGFWTGSTEILITAATRAIYYSLPLGTGDEPLRPGMRVAVLTEEVEDGSLRALEVAPYERGHEGASATEGSITVGKVRSIDPATGRLVIKDMLWSLNWLPFGGFVRLRGEESPVANDSLARKSPLVRAFVLLAGVGINAVLPIIIFAGMALIPQDQVVGDVVVTQVFPGSPAYEAGLRSYSKVLTVDGTPIRTIGELQQATTRRLGAETEWEVQRGIPNPFAGPLDASVEYLPDEVERMTIVPRWNPPRHELVEEVTDPGRQMRLAVAREYDRRVGLNDRLIVVPQGSVEDTLTEVGVDDVREFVPDAQVGDEVEISPFDDDTGLSYLEARQFDRRLGSITYMQEGAVGIMLRVESARIESVSVPFTQAVGDGVVQVLDVLALARNGIIGAITGSSNPQFDAPVAVGPVGIGQLSGEVATADIPLSSRLTILLSLTATLSISLAVINLLPIPGLDGGRLLFVIIEVVRGGRRIPPERENLVHLAGFAVLLALLLFVTVVDVSRLIGGESFF